MRWIGVLMICASCGGGAAAHTHPRAAHDHGFHGAEEWAELFDDPARDAWQRPDEVVRLLGLRPGDTVADIGAGTGYFLPHLSRAVEEHGTVLGLDVEADMVRYMRERVVREALSNVRVRQVPPEDPEIDSGTVDKILIVNTWHHIQSREAYAARLRDALRSEGCDATSAVVIVDFTRDAPEGPPPEMRLEPEVVAAELRAGGLEVRIEEETLPRQYVVVGTRPASAECGPISPT